MWDGGRWSVGLLWAAVCVATTAHVPHAECFMLPPRLYGGDEYGRAAGGRVAHPGDVFVPAPTFLERRVRVHPPVLSAGQGAGEGAGQRLVLQGGVELREAEGGFVDEEENLEEGETLIRSIKAFDDRGVLLCAGALVRSTLTEGGGEGDTSKKEVFHDLWLGDSAESGVGPNLQIKGSLAVLDGLFLQHLRHCEYFGVGFPSNVHFRVHAEGELASSCRLAAQQRGFSFEEVDETGEDIFVFDSWHTGPEAYTRAALTDGGYSPRSPSFAREILQQLSRTLPPLPLPRAGVRRYGAWEGEVVSGVLGGADDEGFGVSGGIVADGLAWGGAEGWSMQGAQQLRRKRVRQYHVGRGVVGAQTIQGVVDVCDESLRFDGSADSVDGVPAWYASLISQGQAASGAAEARILELMRPAISEAILPLVREGFGRHDVHVCEAFVRVYARSEGGSPAPAADAAAAGAAGGLSDGRGGGTGRMSIASHYDSLAFATVVVSLNPDEYSGGIYLQAGAHAASRRKVEMLAGDVLVHGHDMMHGVEVASGRRYSMVLWMTAGEDACAARAAPWLRSAALAGDDVAQYALAALLDKESEGADDPEALDGEEEAAGWYFASAAQGNPFALTRVGSLLSEDEEDSATRRRITAWAGAELGAAQAGAIPGFSSSDHAESFFGWLAGGSASKCWEEAALQGYAPAQVALGEAYRDGSCGVEEDAWKARCLLTLAAQQGDAEGAYALAELLLSDPGRFSCSNSSSGDARGALGGVPLTTGDAGQAGAAEWEPSAWAAGEERLHTEALDCLRLAAGKAYEPAVRRLSRMGLPA